MSENAPNETVRKPRSLFWRIARWCLIGMAVLITVLALLGLEETWRAKRDMNRFRAECKAKGDPLDMAGVPLSRHLGRTLLELLPQPVAQELENTVLRVFAEEQAVRNLELTTPALTTPVGTNPAVNPQRGKPARSSTWLASAYPVRTTPPRGSLGRRYCA